ncbi:ferric reductase NAD binding domain-containing protein [Suillus fuscotomentosus]|uniref:ferric-chelate reductase (NADPH) n=1 Tax=Suillus fuscotomentosus TaxID=1912939 RepID=A0AAD4DUD5_9AGAM|nr:ferric reductase NAD binding domain-containing protein [Suillus fuscotomentosus]KAG1894070.1 ferric reductase NAD binding domain-containing protein [Suillus fuscotomentosus]
MTVTDKSLRSTRNQLYPQQASYCIRLFIFIIAIFQWIPFFHSKFAGRRQTSNASDPEHASVHRRHHAFSWRRIPLGLVNAYRVISFRWTLEFGKSYTLNMAEVFVTVAYIVFLFVWTFINTTDLESQKLDISYWCNRSGMLASSQFPLITALGTKNNIVSLITGISYDKLNYSHLMSRVVFVLLWVHVGGEIVRHAPYVQHPWLLWGLVVMVASTILCIVSLRPVRAQAYGLFFYVHFAMFYCFVILTNFFSIFLIGAYIHTQDSNVAFWIYPCFVIWGLDRLIRTLRLVVFNHSYFGFSSGSTMDTIAELLLSDDFVRLRFHRPSHFHWTPGQTAYLIMPSVSRLPFEAHPFTIASFNSTLFDVPKEQKPTSEKYAEMSLAEGNLGSSAPEGFTAHLKDAALKGDKVKVFVDGPYGPSPNLGSYDTSVLIAGGSGVSYTLPVLLDTIERVCNGESRCRRVVFIWSIRSVDHIHWIDDVLIRALQLAPPLYISIHIHVTDTPETTETLPRSYSRTDDVKPVRDDSRSEVVELQDGKAMEISNDSLFAIESVKFAHQRADLRAILRDEVTAATGRMSVSVCGYA